MNFTLTYNTHTKRITETWDGSIDVGQRLSRINETIDQLRSDTLFEASAAVVHYKNTNYPADKYGAYYA